MAQEWLLVVHEREEKMVTPSGENPTLKPARFLIPSVTCIDDQVVDFPLFEKIVNWPSEVLFNGWRCPQRKWKQWVDQMCLTYEPIWKTAGIFDSIIASTYQIRKDKELVLGLTEFWCPETNTFLCPWGEATITLEDMFILGGFSVSGEPVTSPILAGDLLDIQEKLIEEHNKFWKYKAAKPCHSEWINRFMGSNCELEHVVFLCLWLSRYVLPTYPQETITKQIFPIAIHLSKATRIALAPAVLASLYRDLRVLKHVAASITTPSSSSSSSNELRLNVWAPFQIMQIWAWEHLRNLGLKPNSLNHDEPRAARWHKITSKLKLEAVRLNMCSIENFELRPYSHNVDNWRIPSFYEEQEGWVYDSLQVNDELQLFSRCIVACELVGLDSIEQYLPFRVAMQFGMAQDLPGHFTRANANWESAWRTYDRYKTSVSFYLPPRVVVPIVTLRYFEWWRQCWAARQDAVVSPPPGFPRKYICLSDDDDGDDDEDGISHSQRSKHFKVQAATANAHEQESNTQFRSRPSSAAETEIDGKKMLIDLNREPSG